MPNRAYHRIPTDVVQRVRELRAEGQPLKAIARAVDYQDIRYLSKIALGQRRQRDPGPTVAKSARPLTQDERKVIQDSIAINLRWCGKPASESALSRIIGRNHGGVVRERARIISWFDRFFAYIRKGTSAECWLWTGGTNHNRPRYMDSDRITHDPRRLAFRHWGGRLDKKERLRPCPQNPLCCNPRHLEVIPRKVTDVEVEQAA